MHGEWRGAVGRGQHVYRLGGWPHAAHMRGMLLAPNQEGGAGAGGLSGLIQGLLMSPPVTPFSAVLPEYQLTSAQ